MGNSRHIHFGFTLIELMVTLAVAAILVTVAIPGFRNLVMDNQLITQTNTLVSSLNLARSEAVKRGVPMTVCPSSSGTACTASNWKDGWIVFTDGGTAGAVDGTDQIVLVQQRLNGSTTLSLNGGGYVRYDATGFLASSCSDECGNYASLEGVADDPTATMTWGTRLVFALLPIREAHASGSDNNGHAYAYGQDSSNEHSGSADHDNEHGDNADHDKEHSGDNDAGSNFGGNSDNDVLGTGNSGNGVGNTGTGNQGNDAAVGNAAGGGSTSSGGGSTSGSGTVGSAAAGGSTFTVCDSRSSETGRSISISATGRVATQRVSCH